ncbi:hypothetical protein SLA2020_405180 [Shorea laevis]
MGGNGVAAVVFLFLIFSGVSNASLFWKLRKLADVTQNNSSAAAAAIPTVSPLPNPGTVEKKPDPEVDGSGKSGSDSSKLDLNVSNGTGSTPPPAQKPEVALEKTDLISPPPQNLTDTGKNSELNDKDVSKSKGSKEEEEKKNKKGGEEIDSGQSPNSENNGDTEKKKETKEEEEKKKSDSEDKNELQDKETKEGEGKKNDTQPNSGETCEDEQRCKDENFLVACIKHFDIGSKELAVIVQNEGEETLEVNLIGSTSMENHFKLPKHGTHRITISLASIQSDKLVVSAGHGNCSLHTDSSVSRANFFFLLPSYDNLVSPINGAYFLIATVVIFVATWACCKVRNSRRQRLDGIPYQELEMGRPESMSATVVETAEGWDEGWDDDWDEEHAMKSPAARHLGNISANGLTARSSNKDGWENDWDD